MKRIAPYPVLADEVTVTLGDVEVAFTPERLR